MSVPVAGLTRTRTSSVRRPRTTPVGFPRTTSVGFPLRPRSAVPVPPRQANRGGGRYGAGRRRLVAQVRAYVPQLWLCRTALRPPQEPVRGRTSTLPVVELRRKRRLSAPDSSTALAILPSGRVTRVPAVT